MRDLRASGVITYCVALCALAVSRVLGAIVMMSFGGGRVEGGRTGK